MNFVKILKFPSLKGSRRFGDMVKNFDKGPIFKPLTKIDISLLSDSNLTPDNLHNDQISDTGPSRSLKNIWDKKIDQKPTLTLFDHLNKLSNKDIIKISTKLLFRLKLNSPKSEIKLSKDLDDIGKVLPYLQTALKIENELEHYTQYFSVKIPEFVWTKFNKELIDIFEDMMELIKPKIDKYYERDELYRIEGKGKKARLIGISYYPFTDIIYNFIQVFYLFQNFENGRFQNILKEISKNSTIDENPENNEPRIDNNNFVRKLPKSEHIQAILSLLD